MVSASDNSDTVRGMVNDNLKDSGELFVDFKALAERCLGNQALMSRVIARFQSSLELTKTEFQTALAGVRWDSLRQLSHRLKGEAANVEAIQIRNAAKQVEESIDTKDEELAQQAVNRLIVALQMFQAQVQVSPTNS